MSIDEDDVARDREVWYRKERNVCVVFMAKKIHKICTVI